MKPTCVYSTNWTLGFTLAYSQNHRNEFDSLLVKDMYEKLLLLQKKDVVQLIRKNVKGT